MRCFAAVAEELHFGRAARRLEILPAALGRRIRQLEENLGVRLLLRTTRSVALTPDGVAMLEGAQDILARADALARGLRERARRPGFTLKIGAIDTAAAGLVPDLLQDFRKRRPDVVVQLTEDKTIRLLPRLLSGRLDLALIRPPGQMDRRIEHTMLFHETPVVAVPVRHALARRRRIGIGALADQPLIVPDRRSRPHSHDLTIKLFAQAGLRPHIVQVAEEKQTILGLVAARLGLAVVPRSAARLGAAGVRFVPLVVDAVAPLRLLPLAAAWSRGSRDPVRDEMLSILRTRLSTYAAKA